LRARAPETAGASPAHPAGWSSGRDSGGARSRRLPLHRDRADRRPRTPRVSTGAPAWAFDSPRGNPRRWRLPWVWRELRELPRERSRSTSSNAREPSVRQERSPRLPAGDRDRPV